MASSATATAGTPAPLPQAASDVPEVTLTRDQLVDTYETVVANWRTTVLPVMTFLWERYNEGMIAGRWVNDLYRELTSDGLIREGNDSAVVKLTSAYDDLTRLSDAGIAWYTAECMKEVCNKTAKVRSIIAQHLSGSYIRLEDANNVMTLMGAKGFTRSVRVSTWVRGEWVYPIGDDGVVPRKADVLAQLANWIATDVSPADGWVSAVDGPSVQVSDTVVSSVYA